MSFCRIINIVYNNQLSIEKGDEMGRIERAPDWILKYEERIREGTFKVKEIQEAESQVRATPIKLSTVMRAINAMGYHTADLRSGGMAEETEKQEHHEERGAPGRIKHGPGWLQKYRDRIESRTITAEDIQEAENQVRATPIKLSTVMRAINAMGYHTADLRRGRVAEETAKQEHHEERGAPGRIGPGPGWLQKYRDRIEKGTITAEDVLEAENQIRAIPIKRSTVMRAINAMGYHTAELRREKMTKASVTEEEIVEQEDKSQVPEMSPYWIRKYKDKIGEGRITAEDIQKAENRIRAAPVKLSTVARAINLVSSTISSRKGEEPQVIKTGGGLYSSYIGEVSDTTEERFEAIKASWEEDLGKPLPNDYFLNVLLALAKLVGHGKTIVQAK